MEFLACDTTSKPALEKLLADTLAKSGRVDILVKGAGVNSATPFLDIAEAELDRVLAVNFKGLFLACQVSAATWRGAARAALSTSARPRV